jgi:hypothetical protein
MHITIDLWFYIFSMRVSQISNLKVTMHVSHQKDVLLGEDGLHLSIVWRMELLATRWYITAGTTHLVFQRAEMISCSAYGTSLTANSIRANHPLLRE